MGRAPLPFLLLLSFLLHSEAVGEGGGRRGMSDELKLAVV